MKGNYLKIRNDIFEALMRTRIPGESRQILDCIIRKTYGFNKSEETITLAQFHEATGIKKSHIYRGIDKLREMNIVPQKGKDVYRINTTTASWKPLPKKVTVPQKGKECSPKREKPFPKKGTFSDDPKDTLKDTLKDIKDVLAYWNSKKITVHRELTPKMKGHIVARMERYSLEEIKQKIDNYEWSYNSKETWWTQKWALSKLLTQETAERFWPDNFDKADLMKSTKTDNKEQYKGF